MSVRFEVLETLESHQRASLCRARDATTGGEVTLRRYHADQEDLEGQRELLQVMQALQHPNLEHIIEAGHDEEGLFAIVDPPSGMSLLELLREGPLSEAQFEQMARQILAGLVVLHERGIAHLSLRPEVIRVEKPVAGKLDVRVGGFGEGFGRKSETEHAEPPAYRCTAPEQWKGDAVGRRTDVYALGCIFYEALAGKPPFRPDSINGLRAAHLAHDVVPLSREAPQVRPWIAAWVMRLIDPDMNTRPRDAGTARKLFELREHGMQQAQPAQAALPPGYGPSAYPYAPSGYGPATSQKLVVGTAMVPLTRAITPMPAASTTAFQPVPIGRPPQPAPAPVASPVTIAPPHKADISPALKKILTGAAATVLTVSIIILFLMPARPKMASLEDRMRMVLPVVSGVSLHLDASREDTIETTISNRIKRWADGNNKGRFAAPSSPEAGPELKAGVLSGLPVADFGPYHSEHWMEFRQGSGSTHLRSIRSAFWVLRGSGFLLGDDQAADFYLGSPEGNPDAGIFGSAAAEGIKSGVVRLNGQVVKSLDSPLPKSFSLVSLVTAAPVTASRLCKDRSAAENRVGGQEIAEIILYDRPLSEAEVRQVETYLRTKWLSP